MASGSFSSTSVGTDFTWVTLFTLHAPFLSINKDGYYENMKIFMDVTMNITDMETSEVDVMNYKIDMNMDCKNPGKEVLFELPSTDGFEELNLLGLTGEEQE